MKAPGLDGASRPFRQDWLGETPGRRPPHNPKTPLKNAVVAARASAAAS